VRRDQWPSTYLRDHPTATNSDAETYRLAYEQASYNVRRQEAALDELRQRTGVLVAAATIVFSFLGQEAARDGWGWSGIIAVATFVLAVGLWLWILNPGYGWIFSNSIQVLFEDIIESPSQLGSVEMYRRLAIFQAGHVTRNATMLEWRYRGFTAGIVLLVVQTVLLLFDMPSH
jgi:hypothetical protein